MGRCRGRGFCSGSPDKQLVLVQNAAPKFSFLTGPTPHRLYTLGGTSNLNSNSSYPWRAVAAGNLDASPEEEFVAVLKITANPLNLVNAMAGIRCHTSDAKRVYAGCWQSFARCS